MLVRTHRSGAPLQAIPGNTCCWQHIWGARQCAGLQPCARTMLRRTPLPVHEPMYTRSILTSEHSRASLRLSGEWGAATTGSSFATSHLRMPQQWDHIKRRFYDGVVSIVPNQSCLTSNAWCIETQRAAQAATACRCMVTLCQCTCQRTGVGSLQTQRAGCSALQGAAGSVRSPRRYRRPVPVRAIAPACVQAHPLLSDPLRNQMQRPGEAALLHTHAVRWPRGSGRIWVQLQQQGWSAQGSGATHTCSLQQSWRRHRCTRARRGRWCGH